MNSASTGNIRNIEDKDALLSPISSDLSKDSTAAMVLQAPGKVFQGGCWQDLHRVLQVSCGDRILYVGDHMYSDILRSKRTLGWRTCLIIPELEDELAVAQRESPINNELLQLRQLQYDLDEYVDLLRLRVVDNARSVSPSGGSKRRIRKDVLAEVEPALREAETKAAEVFCHSSIG